MSCYISSNNNRVYTASEPGLGQISMNGFTRIPTLRLAVKESVESAKRHDKTGTRTYLGVPNQTSKTVSYMLQTYMTAWESDEDTPCYDSLFRATLGGVGIVFDGATISSVVAEDRLTFAAPHGLSVGQGVRVIDELRFVSNIQDDFTITLNAPLSRPPESGTPAGRTITYLPSNSVPTMSVLDYWDPAEAVQRAILGCAVNRCRIAVNGDFHKFEFSGQAVEIVDSYHYSSVQGAWSAFPAEPSSQLKTFSLVPGNLGQAWFGPNPTQFQTVVEAEISIRNNIDLRRRDFGATKPTCVLFGERSVEIDIVVAGSASPETIAIYDAAVNRMPIGVMLQLGTHEGRLCAIYMPAVVPEPPEFEDDDLRLQWRFRKCRAQGSMNDEISIAFG